MCAGTTSADATCPSESPPRTPLFAVLRHIAHRSGFNGTWEHCMTCGPDAPKALGLQHWGLLDIDPLHPISLSLVCAPQFHCLCARQKTHYEYSYGEFCRGLSSILEACRHWKDGCANCGAIRNI